MILEELFNKYGSDKGSCFTTWSPDIHHYYRLYSMIFDPIRKDVKSLLELGVALGSSIKAFREYFTNAEIWGVDTFDWAALEQFEKNDILSNLNKTYIIETLCRIVANN